MTKIKIKPLSANQAWRGRRFKTDNYKSFEKELYYLLPKLKIPVGKLKVFYKFGLSNKQADADNCIKQCQDILCKKYNFNDNKIYKWIIEKVITKKGEEFIEFNIETYE